MATTVYIGIDALGRERDHIVSELRYLGDDNFKVETVELVDDGPYDIAVMLVGESIELLNTSIFAGIRGIRGIIRGIFPEALDF